MMKDMQAINAPMGANVDFHTHSNYSIDGTKSIKTLIRNAQKHNTVLLGVTDHNTINGVNNYLDKLNIDRQCVMNTIKGKTAIVPGVEITVRIEDIKNKKGKPVKLHLVAYGLDRDDSSPISKLLKMKGLNDKHVDLGFVSQVENYFNLHISDQDIFEYFVYCRKQNKEVSSFGKQETLDLLKFLNLQPADSDDELLKIIDKFDTTDRLNLEAKDVINLVHASGGIVLLAHPVLNLQKTNYQNEVIDYLIRNEIDGFEMYYPQNTKACDIYLRKVCKENHIKLHSGGSDYHDDNTHYNREDIIPFEAITTNKLQAFIDYLYDLDLAHQNGTLILKNYKNLQDFNPEETLEKYRLKYCIYEHLNKFTPIEEIPEY